MLREPTPAARLPKVPDAAKVDPLAATRSRSRARLRVEADGGRVRASELGARLAALPSTRRAAACNADGVRMWPSSSPSRAASASIRSCVRKSSQVKSSQVKSSQVKPSQVKPSQAKPSQVKPSQAKPSQAKQSQVKSSQVWTCLRERRRPRDGAEERRVAVAVAPEEVLGVEEGAPTRQRAPAQPWSDTSHARPNGPADFGCDPRPFAHSTQQQSESL